MFKPQLAPNQSVKLDSVFYPLFSSYKLDGIRMCPINGELLSRSLKPIQNKQLQDIFKFLKVLTKKHNIILDGEIYGEGLTFQQIYSYVCTDDFTSERSIKRNGKVLQIPDELKFYCFDCIIDENYSEPFVSRVEKLKSLLNNSLKEHKDRIVFVEQTVVNNEEEVKTMYREALENGCEGLILKSLDGRYKRNRGTIKEGLIYKVKPFNTYDAKIIRVEQGTVVNPNAEKTTNELGRSVTSRKKGDRVLINKASCFWVMFGDKELKVTIASTSEDKVEMKKDKDYFQKKLTEIWANQEKYIGRYIEYKGMSIGAKDVPRHPVMVRFREDKD